MIKVDGQVVNSPFMKQIIEGNSITMEAITPQVYNSVKYVFDRWSDGDASNPRVVTPDSHKTYTANFIKHVSVYISGPAVAPCDVGTWTANVSDGFLPYSYQWYHKWVCDGEPFAVKSGGIQPLRPCDEWMEVGTNSPTLQMYLCGGSSMLKVVVTDSRGYQAYDEYYVSGSGGGIAPKLGEKMDFADLNLPDSFYVEIYPNPFNSAARIRYSLPEGSYVKLVVYDVLGRVVRVLEDGFRGAGYYDVVFDAGNWRVC